MNITIPIPFTEPKGFPKTCRSTIHLERTPTCHGHFIQVRLGPLWITITDDNQITVWWSHWLRILHGSFWVHRESIEMRKHLQ